MKVLFMGTPEIAAVTLEKIIEAGHEVVGVFTQPDKPKGRGKEMSMPAVKEKALELGLKVFQPERVRDPEIINQIKELGADVNVVLAFGQILPKELLEMPEYGCVNIHTSLLPAYRGAAPIQWAVIDGLEKTGVTTMLMDEGIDTGDILMQEEVVLDKKETAGSLYDKLAQVGAGLLVKTLAALEAGTIVRKKQDHSKANYAKKLDKNLGKIEFEQSASTIECLIRGLNPWPSAYTYIDGKVLKIWDADVVEADFPGEAGTVVKVDKKHFLVKCGKYALQINELQLEGKKRMPAEAFLAGTKLIEGTKLG